MQLSSRTEYAARALIALAREGAGESPVQLADLAAGQELPLDYLAQLVGTLKSGGLVATRRGPGGGLLLARPPGDVSLAEVVQLMEGSFSPAECGGEADRCRRADRCALREAWDDLARAIAEALGRHSLASLARRQDELCRSSPMYHI
ncbi:MAG TPA: Rrf2 family transcriptional regulator [Bacillota bacterium]|nr:Rrf2 family transcriptional regulator [Bacillota bacterium]